MRSILLQAAIALTTLATAASAQPGGQGTPQPRSEQQPEPNPSPVALTDDNIVAPEHPTRGNRFDIGLIAQRPIRVTAATATVSGLVNGETLALPGDSVSLRSACDGRSENAGAPGRRRDFPIEVQPGHPCTIGVTFNAISQPGHYTAKIWLFGSAGERKLVKLDFARRRSIWSAIGLVFAGLIVGFLVTSWRGGGRERTKKVIAIKEAVEALKALDGAIGRPPRMGPIIGRAREMEAALLRAAAVDDAEIAELQARVSQYRFLRDIEARGASLPEAKQRELAAAIGDAVDVMLPLANGKLAAVPDQTFRAVTDKLKALEQTREADSLAFDSALPGEELPLPVTQQMSSATARLAFAIAEWGTAVILMLVFAVVAIGTLYVGNSYWGSYGDLLAAFMIGFGAYAGAVASVDAFVQRARQPA